MSDNIICPECGAQHSIADMELWAVYEEDGKETEIDCSECEAELLISSEITGWAFNVEKVG